MSNGEANKASHQKVNVIATSRCLKLLHVDLMGPTRTESLGGKRYIMVIVDDFSRYTWVEFLREKLEACEKMEVLCKRLQNERGSLLSRYRAIMTRNLRMQDLILFAKKMGLKRNSLLLRLLNKIG